MLLPLCGFEIGKSPISGGYSRFVSFLGRLCKLPDIFFGGLIQVQAILGVIQFLLLNSNGSLIISRKESKAF